MSMYTVGFRVQHIQELLTTDKLATVKPGDVIVCLADKVQGAVAQAYGLIKKAIMLGARPVLVGYNMELAVFKTLSMLMVAYEHYDMYIVYEWQELNKQFLDTIAGRQASIKDVASFVDAKLASYDSLGSFLMEIQAAVASNSVDKVKALVSSNMQSIYSAIACIDELKHFARVGQLNEGVVGGNDEAAKLREELDKTRQMLKELEDKAYSAGWISEEEASNRVDEAVAKVKKDSEDKIRFISGELKAAKEQISRLESDINGTTASIRTYTEIKTSLIHCRTKSVLYFKEISSVRYAPTLITQLVEITTKLRKLRTKLVIYDNPHGLVTTYKPLPVITYQDFVAKKNDVLEKMPSLVVIEPHASILEGILCADYDVVIVVDRLKQPIDVVSGNNVHKYWIINSVQDSYAIKGQMSVDPRMIVSSRGEFSTGFSIESVPEYREKTTSAKMQEYLNMKNHDGSLLIDGMLKAANVTNITGRSARG